MNDRRDKLSDWDNDYSRGEHGEHLLSYIMQTGEVKTDYRWQETGNIFVEVWCYHKSTNKYEPSGLSVTKAKYWQFVLINKEYTPIVISVPTELLKKIVKNYGRKVENVNSENPSVGYLIRLEHIIEEYLKGNKDE